MSVVFYIGWQSICCNSWHKYHCHQSLYNMVQKKIEWIMSIWDEEITQHWYLQYLALFYFNWLSQYVSTFPAVSDDNHNSVLVMSLNIFCKSMYILDCCTTFCIFAKSNNIIFGLTIFVALFFMIEFFPSSGNVLYWINNIVWRLFGKRTHLMW